MERKTGKVSARFTEDTIELLHYYADKYHDGNRSSAMEAIITSFIEEEANKDPSQNPESNKTSNTTSDIDNLLQEEIKFANDIEPDKIEQYVEDRQFVYGTQLKILEAIACRAKRKKNDKKENNNSDTFGE